MFHGKKGEDPAAIIGDAVESFTLLQIVRP